MDDSLDGFIVDDDEDEGRGKKKGRQNKRASPNKSKGSQQSAPKMDKLDKKYAEMVKNGELKKCTVGDLKEFLTVKNMPAVGKKDMLIELITSYFEEHFGIS
mmetsp:Transcript_34757/g.25913  ORF Transcript_34757/g.25913 Transcript_34757/m.25913 type:complete len:102 (+) Transcript_34757:1953-2258(+)